MTRTALLLAVMSTAPLLTSGCLYTKSQVQSRFYVQLLDRPSAVITVSNRSPLPLEVCDHGGTDSYCRRPRSLAPGESLELDYRARLLLAPIPEEPCFGEELCVTADLERPPDNRWPESSDYLLNQLQQVLTISLRRPGAPSGQDAVATGDFREGDGCFEVTITGDDEFDPLAEPAVRDENGIVLASSSWRAVDCGAH